jgi:DNA topoisomerase I
MRVGCPAPVIPQQPLLPFSRRLVRKAIPFLFLSPHSQTMPSNENRQSATLTDGLVYVSPDMPGMSRVKRGATFRYRDAKGNWLRDVDEISRIRHLAIPPA